jgi:galactokinase
MSRSVPVANALADIYPPASLATEAPRWNHLLTKFESVYGHPASFVARSPGRVNIIGEHIDYSLYSVLPMAITADALLAVSHTPVADDAKTFRIRIANVDDKFEARDFEVPIDGDVTIDATKLEWTNYFKSGLQGVLGLLRKKHGAGFRPCNMELLMDGTVPVGGGLSSSAAVVSTSSLAILLANGEKEVDKKELTELAIVNERAVGVNSGGYVISRLHTSDNTTNSVLIAWTRPPLFSLRKAQPSLSPSAQASRLDLSSSPLHIQSSASLSCSPLSHPTSRLQVQFTTTYV